MDSFEPKKLALLYILQILERYTDCDHPLKHDEIVRRLESDFDVTIERKAVGRNIALLQKAGYDVETTKKGSYLASRLFEDSELRLLSDSVLASQHITAKHSRQIIDKIATLSNKYFKTHIKNVYSVNDWNKSDNSALFYNIDTVDEAIEKGLRIKFEYSKYGMDKKLHCVKWHVASPYQMILHNQRYFLMAREEKYEWIVYYRMDKITDIQLLDERATPLRSLKGYENGIDYRRFSASLPYMFSDELEQVTFAVDEEWMIDQLVDWFGFDFKTVKKDGKIIVTVNASVCAMEYWATQYLNYVEILTPESLRKKIAESVKKATAKYSLGQSQ